VVGVNFNGLTLKYIHGRTYFSVGMYSSAVADTYVQYTLYS
jgi:hypothetical protein